MKKHFWILGACLVYLPCLWVALSSVFLPNWILCTQSQRSICISSHARHIYLPHTCATFAFMCLLLACIITARALPSHVFAFIPPLTLSPRPLFKHQKGGSGWKTCASVKMNPQKRCYRHWIQAIIFMPKCFQLSYNKDLSLIYMCFISSSLNLVIFLFHLLGLISLWFCF